MFTLLKWLFSPLYRRACQLHKLVARVNIRILAGKNV